MASLHDAVELHKGGQLAEAEAIYLSIESNHPDFPDALHLLGMIRLNQGNVEEALRLVLKAITLNARPLYFYNLGLIRERRQEIGEAVYAYEKAIALDPRYGSPYLNLGKLFEDRQELDKAMGCYDKLRTLEPHNAVALTNLGNVYKKKMLFQDAVACYDEAAVRDLGYAEPLFNWGVVLLEQGDYATATEKFKQCLNRNSGHYRAWSSLGLCFIRSRNYEQADHCFQKSLSLNGEYWDGLWNYSLSRLLQGDFRLGFELYEHRWKRSDAGTEQSLIGGNDLTKDAFKKHVKPGDTVAVYCEQGIGDSFQFIRFFHELKKHLPSAQIACPKVLEPILRLSFEDTSFIKTQQQSQNINWRCAVMSLPHVLDIAPQDYARAVPYLKAEEARKTYWRQRLNVACGSKFRVGVVWQGNPNSAADQGRSIPLHHFEPIARLPHVQLVSLQKNSGEEQLGRLTWKSLIVSFGEELDRDGAFLDSAAIIKNLDLLVCSDTAIAHLAGGLGAPTWVALQLHADWRWMDERDDTPWYPSLKLFRQSQEGDWQELLNRIAATIQGMFLTPIKGSP